MPFRGRKILLTGGAGGIGSALGRRLLRAHARLAVVGRRHAIDYPASYYQADLSTLEGIQSVADFLGRHPPDILINLAGVMHFGELEHQSAEHIALTFATNLLAPVLLCKAVLPAMKYRRGGQIVNVGSVFGAINFAHFATYSSSKAGLHGFSEALRREVAGSDIAVTYIAPRAVRTPFNNDLVMRWAALTKTAIDDAEPVADKILYAIAKRKKDFYIGFPESLFVRLNRLLPRLVDKALASNDSKAKRLFQQLAQEV